MELKFKILVLRLLMMIVHRLVSPSRDKDAKEVDRLAVEVHLFIQEVDNYVALSHSVNNGADTAPGIRTATPDRLPARAPLRMKSSG